MKNILKTLLPVLFAALIIAGCSRESGGKEESSDSMSTIVTDTGTTGIPADAEKGLSLTSGDAALSFYVKDDSIVINSFGTDKHQLAADAACTLPAQYRLNDGDFLTEFSWKFDAAYEYTGDREEAGYKLVFTDENAGMKCDIIISARTGLAGPFEFYGYLYCTGEKTVLVQPDSYFAATIKKEGNPTAWTFGKEGWLAEGVKKYSGEYYSGTGIRKKEIKNNTIKASCKVSSDYPNPGSLPMMYIDGGDYGLIFAQEWSSGLLTAKGKDDTLTLGAALDPNGELSTYLNPGDGMLLPPVYIGVYEGDVEVGSNLFKHWFLRYKAPECMTENQNEPLTQYDYCLETDIENAMKYCGFESLKLDYGWWAGGRPAGVNPGFWMREGLLKEGTHFLTEMKFLNMKALCDAAKAQGGTVTVYYMPRDTMLNQAGIPTSLGKNGHPEWFSNVKINGLNASADFGNTECVAFFQEYMGDFFTKNGITTWRSDFEPICHTSDKANRHKAGGNDVQYWCTVGFGELVDYLYENVPGFRYESCSSGGMMKDLFTATRATVINCDDSSDYNSLHASFYDSSYVFHPAQLQLPCGIQSYTVGGQYYTGTGDFLYGLRCSLTGGVMIGKWNEVFSDSDKEMLNKYVEGIYKEKLRPLIREGDLYHILPRPDGENWDGLEYVDADTDREIKGVVMLWKPTNKEGETKTVKLRGLMADVSYQLTFEDRPEQNRVMTGAELMETGLTVTISGDVGSEMIWLTEAK